MSKKSSTFVPEMRKAYHIPTTEIVCLELQIPIALASSKGSVPANHAPHRRETEVF